MNDEPEYKYVRIGNALNGLAIIEIRTGEPIQFVTGSSVKELQARAIRLANQWEEYFANRTPA